MTFPDILSVFRTGGGSEQLDTPKEPSAPGEPTRSPSLQTHPPTKIVPDILKEPATPVNKTTVGEPEVHYVEIAGGSQMKQTGGK